MRFLIAGHGGCWNLGCQAILYSTLMMLRKGFAGSRFVISSFDWNNDRQAGFGQDADVIPAFCDKVWQHFTWPWLLRQSYKACYRKREWTVGYFPLFGAIRKSDAVLSVGGDNYSMDYGFPDYYLNLNRLVKEKKVRLVIWAASIGPFPEGEATGEIIASLKSADLITARESATIDYLAQFGITDNVRRVADPAFLLPPEAVATENFWPEVSGKSVLGVNISPILHRYGGKHSLEIINETSIFLRRVIKEFGFYILLIPHVLKADSVNNDYIFMKDIYERLKDTQMINRIPPSYNAMQLKYIISRCRFFIGARTHSTIASLSTGVPTLNVGYSLKSKGINKDVFGNYDFLVDIKDLTPEALWSKFTDLCERESEIRKVLSESIPKMKKLAWANVDHLKKILT